MSNKKDIYSKADKDTYSYKGWLISDNFAKRAFAVLGYSWVASLIIWACIMGVAITIGIIVALVEMIS